MTTGYIDISQAQSPSEMLFLLSKELETGNFNSKKIVLNMGKIEVNHPQLLSLKSLISSVDSEIDFIYTESDLTRGAALSVGISVANGVFREVPKEVVAENPDLSGTQTPMSEEEAVNILFSSNPAFVENMQTEKAEETNNSQMVSYIPLEPPSDEEIPEEEQPSEEEDKIEENTEISSEQHSEEAQEEDEEEKEFVLSEDTKKFETVYVKQTIRSGQIVSHDGNVVIIGDCNPGSEIIASGDITVWGELKGIAHAGAQGNESAVIRALKLDAIQLRISGCYARRPDRANIEFVSAPTDTFTPEEARICDGEIIVFTMNSDKIK